jgi:hypothetical protein
MGTFRFDGAAAGHGERWSAAEPALESEGATRPDNPPLAWNGKSPPWQSRLLPGWNERTRFAANTCPRAAIFALNFSADSG